MTVTPARYGLPSWRHTWDISTRPERFSSVTGSGRKAITALACISNLTKKQDTWKMNGYYSSITCGVFGRTISTAWMHARAGMRYGRPYQMPKNLSTAWTGSSKLLDSCSSRRTAGIFLPGLFFNNPADGKNRSSGLCRKSVRNLSPGVPAIYKKSGWGVVPVSGLHGGGVPLTHLPPRDRFRHARSV